MSSIKERAAALNLAEKLCVRPQGLDPNPNLKVCAASGGATKPVQSSSIWSRLISHLRSSVTVKRRLVILKSYNDCFLGNEAVDALAEHIANAEGLEGANVSRDKVVCVCQALLECNVFQAVGTKLFGKNAKPDVFQDSKSALYRFVGLLTPSVDELERGVLVNGIQEFFWSASSDKQEACSSESQVDTSISLPMKSSQLEASLKAEPAAGRVQTHAALPQSVVDEVWQEQTLLRLLNIIELPLLEGVLQCSQTSSSPSPPPPATANLVAHGNPDLIYSSNHLDRKILQAFRSSQDDKWLCAALDCLDFLPDQPVVELSRELHFCFLQEKESCDPEPAGGGPSSAEQTGLSQSGSVRCKLLLYETLSKHYSSTNRPPLLPRPMADVYTAISDLLVNAKLDKALEALQLCLKLLPRSSREEMRRLLMFMSLAADPQGIKVDKEVENRLAVKKSFSRAILHSKTFPKEREDLLLVFMLSNVGEIFKIPGSLHKRVSEKLADLAEGEQPDVTGPALSHRASSRTHVDSSKNTNQELWALLNSIHLDTKRSAKERKRLLRRFYGAHPGIFNQYFGDSAANQL
nr:DEP domain-containing protein 7 isoform X1 [Nothobranchius furzeri]